VRAFKYRATRFLSLFSHSPQPSISNQTLSLSLSLFLSARSFISSLANSRSSPRARFLTLVWDETFNDRWGCVCACVCARLHKWRSKENFRGFFSHKQKEKIALSLSLGEKCEKSWKTAREGKLVLHTCYANNYLLILLLKNSIMIPTILPETNVLSLLHIVNSWSVHSKLFHGFRDDLTRVSLKALALSLR